jgi:predicted component of type VI protein secretion system
MQNITYRLIVRRGPQPNQVFELKADLSNLGRDITNDIVINDREVSRHHLRLMRGAEAFTIEDLGSTNGTFINGKRLTGAIALKNGDMIGLGETVTLQFEALRPGQEAAVPPQQPIAQPAQPAAGGMADDARFRPQPQPQPYQPPQQGQPQQGQPQPYQPPQQGQPQQQQAQPYQQTPPPGYQQPAQDAYTDYYGAQGQAAYSPPPPGYDYDPYATREGEGSNTMQWFLIGCLGLLLLCCCVIVIAAVAIDQMCLYDTIPGLSNLLNAIGFTPTC